MPKDNQQIIESFRKKFVSKHLSGSYVEVMKPATEIEDFILQALSTQESELKAQWRKEVEGMRLPEKGWPQCGDREWSCHSEERHEPSIQYNRFLSDILKKL